ncbi:hypothetical protein CDN98_03830 [Roseateles terrae]|nr:hypothetical protein CDN98_03830 [Roseateles terrae]
MSRRHAGKRFGAGLLATTMLTVSLVAPAQAHGGGLSRASEASLFPVAVSVAVPAVLIGAAIGVTVGLTVKVVESTAQGTVWVLERASDGVQFSVRFVGDAVTASAVAVGTAVTVSVVATGYIVSKGSEVIAFVPNEIGASLMHNERVTRKDEVLR